MTDTLFISYPSESWNFAQRIAEHLGRQVAQTIFIDYRSIDQSDYAESILEHLRTSRAVILVVTEYTFADIHRDDDWVRLEIRTALQNKIPIVMVRENGMLPPKDLPSDIYGVNRAQGIPFYKEFFESGIDSLCKFMFTIGAATPETVTKMDKSSSKLRSRLVTAALLIVLVGGLIIGVLRISQPDGLITNTNLNTPTDSGSGQEIAALGGESEVTPTASLTPTSTPTDSPMPTTTDAPTVDPTSLEFTITAQYAQLLRDNQRTIEQQLTATANGWTDTPTPDVRGTAGARLTRDIGLTLAAASWTKTPTPTYTLLPTETPTATSTPSSTFTPTSTPSHTATLLPSQTFTPTATFTVTVTSSPSATPTNTLVPLGYGRENRVTANDQWTVVTRDFNDITMVLVPTGCFLMGSDAGELNERPVHEQCINTPFWIDQTEVTQVDFLRFHSERDSENTFSGAFLPVESVNWWEANAYCQARSGYLPTERQWEYAARGPDSLIYPWGNEWNPDVVVFGSNSNYQTAPVGSYPAGASWVGALDMSGNVSEHVSSLEFPYPYSMVVSERTSDGRIVNLIRGSSYSNTLPTNHRASVRTRGEWTIIGSRVGFRCARMYNG